MIGAWEVGDIIPFPVLKTPFPVLDSLWNVFFIEGQEVKKIIPFPVFEASLDLLVKVGNIL